MVKRRIYKEGNFYNCFVNTSPWKDYLVQPMKEEDAFKLLSREIEVMKTGAVFAYNCNTTIYTNPVLHLREFNPLGVMSENERKDYVQII